MNLAYSSRFEKEDFEEDFESQKGDMDTDILKFHVEDDYFDLIKENDVSGDVASSEPSTANCGNSTSTTMPLDLGSSDADKSWRDEYKCHLCNIFSANQKEYEKHCSNFKHQKKLKGIEIINEIRMQGDSSVIKVVCDPGTLDVDRAIQFWMKQDANNIGPGKQLEQSTVHEWFQKNVMFQSIKDGTNSFRLGEDYYKMKCTVCDVNLGPYLVKEHLNGSKHLRKIQYASKEKQIVNKDLDYSATKFIQNKSNNSSKGRSCSRSPARRRRSERIYSRSRSRSTDRHNKKFKTESSDRKYRRSRSRSRSRSTDRYNRKSRSKTPDRRYKKSRSRSIDRHRRISRSKSPDRKYRRSRSRERTHKRSDYFDNRKMPRTRSPTMSTKFDKRSRFNKFTKSNENSNVLSGAISDTDIAILDKENVAVTSIVTRIFQECGGKQHFCDLSKIVYRFQTHKIARVVYKLLNNFRTPLGRAKLAYSQEIKNSLHEDSQETLLVMDIIQNSMKIHSNIAIELIKMLGMPGNKIDPYTFKTEKCNFEDCQNITKCTFYHNKEQIRRNPLKVMYSPRKCSDYHLGICFLGNSCNKCHTVYELTFHPDKIHKVVCSHWDRKFKVSCSLNFDSLDCCINAHPETPEVLFNDAWHDLYISELKHTYQYLVGAIQNLRFVDTNQQGIYILVVTPSIFMIHWLIEAIQDLTTALRLDVHMVASDANLTENYKNSKVVLCTPDGASKLIKMPGVSTSLTLVGLILDDVSLLLHRHKSDLDNIGKALMHTTPCIVAVADKVYKQDVTELSALLCTQFNTIGVVKSSKQEKDFPSSLTIDSILTSNNSNRKNESTTDMEYQNRKICELSTATKTEKENLCDISPVIESKKSNKDIENPQNSRDYSAVEACHFLKSFCDHIGILGASLKVTLEKTEFEQDSYRILESLSDADSHELLVLISDKFIKLKDKTQDSILKCKYTQGIAAIKFLMNSTKFYLEFKSNLCLDKQESKTIIGTGKIDSKNCTNSGSNLPILNSAIVMDSQLNFNSSRSFGQNEAKSFLGIKENKSSSLNSHHVLENTHEKESSKLSQSEKMFFQDILGKNKKSVLTSPSQWAPQRNEQSSSSASYPVNYDSSKPFIQEGVKSSKGVIEKSSSSLDSDPILDNTQKNYSGKLTESEKMLFQNVLGKNKNCDLSSSTQTVPQRTEESSLKSDFRDIENEQSSSFVSNKGVDKQLSNVVNETGKTDKGNCTNSDASPLYLNIDNPLSFDSSKSFQGLKENRSSCLNSDLVLGNTQEKESSKLSQAETILFQNILGKKKKSDLPSCGDIRNEESSSSASNIQSSLSEIMDEIGENLDLDINSSINQRTHDTNLSLEVRTDENLSINHRTLCTNIPWEDKEDNTNQISNLSINQKTYCTNLSLEDTQNNTDQRYNNAVLTLPTRIFSQGFMDSVFKVAVFGHEYVEVMPFDSGETFKSKNPGNLFQVIKYVKHGAEILKVHEYDIWKEVISAQPHMIFLVLGKNDITEYASPKFIANRMVNIKMDLKKSIPNVRIVCFGLENCDFDRRWSIFQNNLNSCLGSIFETIIFPTSNVDIGDYSYGAVSKVWRYMQEIIEDIKLQHEVLCKTKEVQSKEVGMNDLLSRYIDLLK